MQVQVRFYGIRRELTDEPSVELRVPQGSSLRNVLNALVERFGERVQRRLFSADGAYLGDMLCVTVNGYIVGDLRHRRWLRYTTKRGEESRMHYGMVIDLKRCIGC